jgi:hypothetical protein
MTMDDGRWTIDDNGKAESRKQKAEYGTADDGRWTMGRWSENGNFLIDLEQFSGREQAVFSL